MLRNVFALIISALVLTSCSAAFTPTAAPTKPVEQPRPIPTATFPSKPIPAAPLVVSTIQVQVTPAPAKLAVLPTFTPRVVAAVAATPVPVPVATVDNRPGGNLPQGNPAPQGNLVTQPSQLVGKWANRVGQINNYFTFSNDGKVMIASDGGGIQHSYTILEPGKVQFMQSTGFAWFATIVMESPSTFVMSGVGSPPQRYTRQ